MEVLLIKIVIVIKIVVYNDSVYGAVFVAYNHCQSSSGLFDKCTLSAKQLPNFGAREPTWVVTHYIDVHYLLLSLKADVHFTVLWIVEG